MNWWDYPEWMGPIEPSALNPKGLPLLFHQLLFAGVNRKTTGGSK